MQIQMITSVSGTLMANVPPITNANSEAKFPTICAARPDMVFLHRAAPASKLSCYG